MVDRDGWWESIRKFRAVWLDDDDVYIHKDHTSLALTRQIFPLSWKQDLFVLLIKKSPQHMQELLSRLKFIISLSPMFARYFSLSFFLFSSLLLFLSSSFSFFFFSQRFPLSSSFFFSFLFSTISSLSLYHILFTFFFSTIASLLFVHFLFSFLSPMISSL